MKFFVTGGAGFIGSRVCRQLVDAGHEVISYDAFIRYLPPTFPGSRDYFDIRFDGIADKVVFIRGDTAHKSDLMRAIQAHRPDACIHLAALPLADLAFDHTDEAIESVLVGAVNVLEAIRETDSVKRFVYASSSMVYGDFQHLPCDEDHAKNPKEIYGSLKLAGETITKAFGVRYGIEWCIIRPSAVYGPTDQNRRVSEIFLSNAIRGEKLVLHGGGENTLDFTYIDDIASGFVLAATHEKAANEVFNITRGEGRSLKDLVDILRAEGFDFPVEIVNQEMYRPMRGALSIQKARDLLGYDPRYSLEDGMRKYIDFYKEHVIFE